MLKLYDKNRKLLVGLIFNHFRGSINLNIHTLRLSGYNTSSTRIALGF